MCQLHTDFITDRKKIFSFFQSDFIWKKSGIFFDHVVGIGSCHHRRRFCRLGYPKVYPRVSTLLAASSMSISQFKSFLWLLMLSIQYQVYPQTHSISFRDLEFSLSSLSGFLHLSSKRSSYTETRFHNSSIHSREIDHVINSFHWRHPLSWLCSFRFARDVTHHAFHHTFLQE